MSSSLIENVNNTNYLFTAFTTTLIRNPTILRNGITNLTPLVQSCNHSSWNDFEADGKNYMFCFIWDLKDYIINTPKSVVNCDIINHGGIQFNYDCPLVKNVNNKFVPITLKDIIQNPLSRIMFSKESGTSGGTLYDYALRIRSAHNTNLTKCPIDVVLMKYDNPTYYEFVYNLIASDGSVTTKRSMSSVIKFKSSTGVDRICIAGTGIHEYVFGQLI